MKTQLKYNLEDKSAKRQTGKGFEVNNYPKLDTLIHNLRLFMNIVVSKLNYDSNILLHILIGLN